MKKKFLSLLLACLMLANVFSVTLPVFAADERFTVTSSAGTTVGSYSTYESAIAAVYTVAKTNNEATYTVTFNDNYTTSSKNIYTNTAEINANIVIEGNNKTFTSSSGSTAAFVFNYGDNVTVKDLTVSTGGRIAEVYRGTSLTFIGCSLTSSLGVSSFDNGGYFRTPNNTSATTTANYLTLENCSIDLTKTATNGAVFGHTSQENIMNVSLKNVTADLSDCAGVKLFMVRGRATSSVLSVDGCNLKLANTAFSNICQSTISITGTAEKPTTITTTGVLFQMDKDHSVNDVTLHVGDNATLSGTSLLDANGTSRKMNVHTTNQSFYYNDKTFKAPTLMEGASVRTTVHSNGLRFTAELTDATATTGGMLVARTSSITKAGEFNLGALAAAGEKYIVADADPAKLYGGKYYIALTDIPDAMVKYSVIPYTVYDIDERVTVRYYSANGYSAEKNSRSIAQVAYLAVGDTSATYTADKYTCKVDDGVWSPYSKTQYSVLEGRYAYRYDPNDETADNKTQANMWVYKDENGNVLGDGKDLGDVSTQKPSSGIVIRDIVIDNNDGVDDNTTLIQLTDMHLAKVNDTDLKNDVINSTYENRKVFKDLSSWNNAKACLDWAAGIGADQTIITGDIYDYMTSAVAEHVNTYIFSAYENIMACIGNHDPLRKVEGTVTDETLLADRLAILSGYWTVNDIYYSSKIVDKVMLIQMDNGSSTTFTEDQYDKLSGDLALARTEGYTVLLFYHVPLATGNPEDVAIESLMYGNGTEIVNNFYNIEAGDLVGHESEGWSGKVYDLIVENGDIIKGAFCGHLHSDFYTEIQATTADGMYTVIPQYVLRGTAYDNGHALKITVK